MTTPDELLRLAERVEQGSGYDQALRNDLIKALGVTIHMGPILASIDAVEALRLRLLPGSTPEGGQRADGSWFAYCTVPSAKKYEGERIWTTRGAKAPTEPRSRLAALLRAVAGKEGQ